MSDVAVSPRYTRVRFPEIGDRELEDGVLFIADPLGLPNLQDCEPPTDQKITYVGRYDYHQKVSCAFKHRHNRGYVFVDEDGLHYLIGNTCGAKQFGMEKWKDFGAGIRRLEDRASDLRSLRRFKDCLARHRDWIASLPDNPSVRSLRNLRGICQRESLLAPLAAELRPAFDRQGGQLFKEVAVRDFDREERWREKRVAEMERNGEPIGRVDPPQFTRQERRSLGTLQGRIVFADGPDPSDAIRIIPGIDAFLASQGAPSEKTKLIEVSRNAKGVIERLLLLREQVEDASSFFDLTNLQRLSEWLATRPSLGMRVVAGRGHLSFERGSKSVRLVAPAPFRT